MCEKRPNQNSKNVAELIGAKFDKKKEKRKLQLIQQIGKR